MSPMPKRVDALTIKRQGAAALAAPLAGMTAEEQRRFWEERTRVLRERQAAKRAQQMTMPRFARFLALAREHTALIVDLCADPDLLSRAQLLHDLERRYIIT